MAAKAFRGLIYTPVELLLNSIDDTEERLMNRLGPRFGKMLMLPLYPLRLAAVFLPLVTATALSVLALAIVYIGIQLFRPPRLYVELGVVFLFFLMVAILLLDLAGGLRRQGKEE